MKNKHVAPFDASEAYTPSQPINLTRTWSTPNDLIRDDLHGLRIHYDGRLLRLSESEIDDIIAIIDKHKVEITHGTDIPEDSPVERMPKSRRYIPKDKKGNS